MDKKWDKGLDFAKTRQKLCDMLSQASRACAGGELDYRYTYLAAMCTQLENGSRVGEAVGALRAFAATGERRQYVLVEKRRDKQHRLVTIPPYIQRELVDPSACVIYRIKNFASRLGMNTHSLRYAWITSMASRGVNPAIIASITGHKSLNMLLHYIQARQGEELLMRSVNGGADGK